MPEFSIRILDRRDPKDYGKWRNFLKQAKGETIFHNPDFLAYHQNQFDESHLGIFKGETLSGVIPMAIYKSGSTKIAKSPYGGSYGGFIFSETLNYSESKSVVQALIAYLKEVSISQLTVTPPLRIFYEHPCDTFIFAMLEQGFKISNSDIESVVQIAGKNIENDLFSSRARRMYKKGLKEDITVKFKAPVDDFWQVMVKTFEKHGARPTHSYEQWNWLCHNLGNDTWCDVAYISGTPVSGIGHVKINKVVDSTFYLCNDPEYQDMQGQTFLIYEAIKKSQQDGFKFFSFGTSSMNMVARENIFQFKENFGALGIFRNTYTLNI